MNQHPLFSKVLLIEDEAAHALIVKRYLSRLASEVVHVSTLEAAVETLRAGGVDLAVSDLHLPNTTAQNTVETLLGNAGSTPVIVLTASTSLEDAVEAMRKGASDFLVKDFGQSFDQILTLSLTRIAERLELQAQKGVLEGSIAALKTAIENSNDAMAVVDEQGMILYRNSALERFADRCGAQDTSELSSIFTAAIHNGGELREAVKRHLKELDKGGVWSTEILFQNEKNVAFDLKLSIARRESKATVAVAWLRDITELKRRERFQREILSTTTHDLRGPLGAILLSAELLEERCEGKTQQLVLKIASSAQTAISLIDEFLSARRIQEGTFVLKPVETDIAELITQVITEYHTSAESKGIILSPFIEEPLKKWPIDPLGFTRVLSNLVSNALKFTARGGRVSISCSTSSERCTMTVADTGAGMEPNEVQMIFASYSRLSRHTSYDGSGLGLFVVKSIVTAHNGSIEVVSKLGEGTSFILTLPSNPPVNDRGELICLDFV